jgi:hypothetical protein
MIIAGQVERRLRQMAGLELGWRLHLAEVGAWAVTAIALVMSYHAEESLGWSLPAFRGWPAFLWPFLVDAMDVVCIVLWLEYKRLRISTWRVAVGAGAATTLMVAANVRSVWAFLGPEGTAVVMQAWAPASALWLWHALAVGRKPRGAPVDLSGIWQRVGPGGWGQQPALQRGDPASEAALGEPDQRPLRPAKSAPMAGERAGRDDVRASMSATDGDATDGAVHGALARRPPRQVVRRLLRQGGAALTVDDVMRRTGVGRRQAQRLLREERQLHVVAREGDQ